MSQRDRIAELFVCNLSIPGFRRNGFGRADAIITVSIAAFLALNFPWVIGRLREASRRHQCAANLRRIGTALQAYHDVHRTLPPAAVWSAEGLDLGNFYKDGRPIAVTRENWARLLLPYLGEREERASGAVAEGEATAIGSHFLRGGEARVGVYSCPSDDYNRADNPYLLTLPDGTGRQFARGNYAINGGSQFWGRWPGYLSNPRVDSSHFEYDPVTRAFEFRGNGVAGINRCFSPDEFANGKSSTVAVDEIRAGIHAIDPRGVWALGQIGGSITWGHGVAGDAGPPNSTIVDADDIAGCGELHRLLGSAKLAEENMPCCEHCNQNQQAGARSRHPGGVHVLMLDGAVHFVSDGVDLGLWQVLHSRETPAGRFARGFEEFLDGTAPGRGEAAGNATVHARRPPLPDGAQGDENARDVWTNSIGMEFAFIPAGDFIMGLPNEGNRFPTIPEAPAHPVTITRPYHLATCEVTQEQFSRVMGASPSWHSLEGGGKELMKGADTARHPVEEVSWHEAAEFCRRLAELPEEAAAGRTYRLPSEAEWEYACRAGKKTPYRLIAEWRADDKTGEIASKAVDKWERVTEGVATYPPNEFGLYDMRGNVFEWTADWYARDYYSRSPVENPRGPAHGYLKVIRGWHWVFTGAACKDHLATEPSLRSRFIGFRVVCDLEQQGER
jgi:prepilin-type processing-associated H-X9-DG protein